MHVFKPAEVAEFRKLFNACDSDSSGELSIEETAKLLGDAGETISVDTLQQLYKEIDTNSDGMLSFDEFMGCMALAKVPAGSDGGATNKRASDIARKFAMAGNAQAKVYKVQGAGNSEHTISEDERSGFAEYINHVLAGDKFLSTRLPMDTTNDDLFSQCSELRYFTDATVNNGSREMIKQGMLSSPVGAIAPPGSSCVITYIYTQDSRQMALVTMTEFVTTISLYSLFEYYWPNNPNNVLP